MNAIADELIGAEVSSVVFVRDYLQLVLEADRDVRVSDGMVGPGPMFAGRDIRISALTAPHVHDSHGCRIQLTDAGWRDALCDLISDRVRDASIVEREEFRIEFDSGKVLTVSLRDDDRRGPEAVNVFGRETWIL